MDNNKFIVSARKYRPSTFSTVVGQRNLTTTLRNAIATDRLAHSYLFCGSRGVGKTSCARIFAKTINCEHRTPDGDPCNECESCRSFNEGRSFNIIELDAASNNGVDDIRKLTEQVMVPPTNGRYRVFIIDEVHMLSSSAFNAFLKTLEEPPSYIIFILATTEKQKIIPTILSRCQIYDFNRITVEDITAHLAHVADSEGIEYERKALSVIATQADGALRDALSIFDQIVASSRGKVTYDQVIANLNILDSSYFISLAKAFKEGDVATALLVFKEIRDKGFNIRFFINGLQQFVRDLMVARNEATLPLLDATDEEKKRLHELAQQFPADFYYMALSLINDADMKYREASNKIFLAELLLIKLCQLLSPSPVFRGKEEGHLDTLKPLGAGMSASQRASTAATASPATAQTAKQVVPEAKITGTNVPAEKQPIKTPVYSTSPARPSSLRSKSIRKVLEGTTEPDVVSESSPSTRNEPFTQEQLSKAWVEYAASVPEKKMLVNVMNGATPTVQSVEPPVVALTVRNRLHNELIADESAAITAFLAQQLRNSHVRLEVTLVESNEMTPQMWSEKEILEHMLETHPEMGRFMNDLALSLS